MTDRNSHDAMMEQIMNDDAFREVRFSPEELAEFERTARIRELNDLLRVRGRGGMLVMTNGVGALGIATVNTIYAAIAAFEEFTPDNDPRCEHDFGAVTVEGHCVLWKIDYYDRARRYHSPDPSDPKVTVRVLTIMLAEEY